MKHNLAIRISGATVAVAIGLMGYVTGPAAHAAPAPASTTAVTRTLQTVTRSSARSSQSLGDELATRLGAQPRTIAPITSQSLAAATTTEQRSAATARAGDELDAQLPQLTDAQKKQILEAIQAIWSSSSVALGSITIPALTAALAAAGVPAAYTETVASIIWTVITVAVSAALQSAIDDLGGSSSTAAASGSAVLG